MTEDEAKTKWCPYSDVVPNQRTSGDVDFSQYCSCIASECMAWRETFLSDSQVPETKIGYCGLAGKP